MKVLLLFSFFSLCGSGWSVLRASELAGVLDGFKEPTVVNAKEILTRLDGLISEGDARTVTLAKKVHRSVKRIFTAEYQILAGLEVANENQKRAEQLDKNGRRWLKPNVLGKINRSAADVAFKKAKALRKDAFDSRVNFSKKWAEETADFEKMLSDLEFSKEMSSIESLGGVLNALVKRMPWVDQPSLKYDKPRILFIQDRIKNKDRWETLARHAADAGDLDLAFELYRKSGGDLARLRIGSQLAGKLTKEGYIGSAAKLWEGLGEVEKAQGLRLQEGADKAAAYRVLSSAALVREVAPACVRVLVPGGHRTGFFYRSGGNLLTCKSGLLNAEGKPGRLA